ncbi:MAG: biotin--[acetyl-CoA-carboxylase] ligase [Syntrophomonadaceae bacterium]|nr:biotin--[acetyl-CoA-carboxylase] ligase [Syntrophomonadaceae bacterium]
MSNNFSGSGNKMRDTILKELWQYKGEYVSGNELAAKLGISRVAVWKHIEALKEEGYDIRGVSGKGYCLQNTDNIIISSEITGRLKNRLIGNQVISLSKVDSTNQVCKQMIKNKQISEGAVIVAAEQLNGKGRLGRKWDSPSGGLWFSLLLSPALPVSELPLLSLVFSIAVSHGLSKFTQVPCQIKWPNDVYLDGKKIAGILLELSGELDGIENVIVGIGINVNINPNHLPEIATSLYEHSTPKINLADVLVEVLQEIEKVYNEFLANGFSSLSDRFQSACFHLGKEVQVQQGLKKVCGINIDIDEMGRLVVQTADGIVRVSTGDVSII